MGSFQQISLGLVCLVAAFAFGNYVNNNPGTANNPLAEANQDVNANTLPANQGLLPNQLSVQPRLLPDDLGQVVKRPAAISTMQTRLTPKFQLPAGLNKNGGTTANSLVQQPFGQSQASGMQLANNDSVLPPPSQLKTNISQSNPFVQKQPENASQARPNGIDGLRASRKAHIPDFSQIAAELNGTPMALPNLGSMPSVASKLQFKPQSPAATIMNNPGPPKAKTPSLSTDLKSLASQFNKNQQEFAPGINDPYATRPPEPMDTKQSFSANAANSNSDHEFEFVKNPSILNQDVASQLPKPNQVSKPTLNWNGPSTQSANQPQVATAPIERVDLDHGPAQTPPEIRYPDVQQHDSHRQIGSPENSIADMTNVWGNPSNSAPPSPFIAADQIQSKTRSIEQSSIDSLRRDSANGVNSRVQIGGIDYDVPPPSPFETRIASRNTSAYRGTPIQNVSPRPESPRAESAESVLDHRENAGSIQNQSGRARTKLPFRLNSQTQSELSQLASKSSSRFQMETKRYREHQVQSGESLQNLATHYFGRPEYYLDIYLANRRTMKNPGDVRPGMTLKIPIYE